MALELDETWLWKEEPWSPAVSSEAGSPWSVHGVDDADRLTFYPDPQARAALAQHVLDDIEEYTKKEETFSEWITDDKSPLPIFDDIQTILHAESLGSPESTTLDVQSLASPESTLDVQQLRPLVKPEAAEVCYILGLGHLTPPQSPPAPALARQQSILIIPPEEPQYVTLESTQPEVDLAREMAVVDEVVRGAAQRFEEWESSDTSRSSATEDSDDPEWMPVDSPVSKPTGRRARQPRPYNVDDRRLRKKEQNKNAATRYRQKKKAEVSVILEEERELEDNNSQLEGKLQDVTREINYLKGLMRELFKAKGLLK